MPSRAASSCRRDWQSILLAARAAACRRPPSCTENPPSAATTAPVTPLAARTRRNSADRGDRRLVRRPGRHDRVDGDPVRLQLDRRHLRDRGQEGTGDARRVCSLRSPGRRRPTRRRRRCPSPLHPVARSAASSNVACSSAPIISCHCSSGDVEERASPRSCSGPIRRRLHQYFPTTKPPSTRRNAPGDVGGLVGGEVADRVARCRPALPGVRPGSG